MTKDMREEKEEKVAQEIWAKILEAKSWPAMSQMDLLESLHEEWFKAYKSLESRLKEADENDEVISQMSADNVEMAKQMDDLQKRLSQAEAENEDLKQERKELAESITEYIKINFQGHEESVKELVGLRKRLSHLMDVGGKMADSLKYAISNLHEDGYPKTLASMRESVAEWDGIKKEGVK